MLVTARFAARHQNGFSMKHQLSAAAFAVALIPALAACGGTDEARDDSTASSRETTSETTSEMTQAAAVTITDPWVKAAPDQMTAAFGVLANTGTQEVTLVSASTEVNARTELHETVQNDDGSMAMQQKQGGFVIAAGDTRRLEPGGDHIMLMDLAQPVETGTTVTITLTFADGSTTTVEATVKAFDGADENYQSDGAMDDGAMDETGGDH